MKIDITIHHCFHGQKHDQDNTSEVILKSILTINKTLKTIMATQAELAQQLRDITAQNEKARVEILGKISELETALENAGSTSPEVDEALDALKASVQTDDDLNPDADPEPTES
jgi:seryl-tRNA synthetase